MVIKGVVDGFSFVAKVVKGEDLPKFLEVKNAVGNIVTHIDFEAVSEDVLERITDLLAGG